MRITGRQLRRIIQEEVARMVNEEDFPSTEYTTDAATGKVSLVGAPGRGERGFTSTPTTAKLTQALQRSTSAALVNAPKIDRSKYGVQLARVLGKLMDGQAFSDRNPDPDAAMVVDLFARELSRANPDNKALAAAVSERLPTSGFSPLLIKLQRMLGIKGDGVLGLQSYFALLTGGAVNFEDASEARTMGRRQAEALMKSLGITADAGKLGKGEIPNVGELIQKIKDAMPPTGAPPLRGGALKEESSKPRLSPLTSQSD